MKIGILALKIFGFYFRNSLWHYIRSIRNRCTNFITGIQFTECPLITYKGDPIIVSTAETCLLVTSIFIYYICVIALLKASVC